MAPRASKLAPVAARADGPTATPSQDPETTKSERRAEPTADTQRGIGPERPRRFSGPPRPSRGPLLMVTTGFSRRVDHNPPPSSPRTRTGPYQ